MAKGKQVRIDHEAYLAIKVMSKRTGVPMSTLLSRAAEQYYSAWIERDQPVEMPINPEGQEKDNDDHT